MISVKSCLIFLLVFILMMSYFSITSAVNYVEFGVCLHWWAIPSDWNDKTASIAKYLGVKWIRSDLPAREYPYDYSDYVNIIKDVKSRGFKVLVILWNPIPFKDLQDYTVYVTAVASQLGDLVDAWEIWSEEHTYGWYDGSAKKYAEMLKQAYTILKTYNPNTVIVGFNRVVAYGYTPKPWIEDVLSVYGTKYVDVVGLHPYHKPYWVPNHPRWDNEVVRVIKSYMLEIMTLVEKDIWIVESGWSSYWNDIQTQSLAMTYAIPMFASIAKTIFWYELVDDINYKDSDEGYYGLIKSDYTKKSSFWRYKFYINYYQVGPTSRRRGGGGFHLVFRRFVPVLLTGIYEENGEKVVVFPIPPIIILVVIGVAIYCYTHMKKRFKSKRIRIR